MKLALGSVQFGLSYGIANTSGQVVPSEVSAILNTCRDSGIDTLDTAIAYGESEQRLGEAGVAGFHVVSKLPKLETGHGSIALMVEGALQRLGVPVLDGLLLHRSEDLCGPDAGDVYAALGDLKARGLVRKIGISIYDPAELDAVLTRFAVDLVQAPYNVVDRRLDSSGWLARLKDAGVEVHTRSAMLQGLLLMEPTARPAYFTRWPDLWAAWDGWVAGAATTRLAAALGFVLAENMIDKVVVGVDSDLQLHEILEAAATVGPIPPSDLAIEDTDLINPARWTSK